MAGQPDPAPTRNPKGSSAPRVHRILRWAMGAYVTLIVFLVLALLGNILLVPLAQKPDHWGDAVGQQMTTLLTLATSYPLAVVVVVAVLVALYWLCSRAQAAWKAEEEAASKAALKGAVKDEVKHEVKHEVKQEVKSEIAQDLPQMIEAAALRATKAAPTIPLTVVSPSGLPRPATLVGRETELQTLMDGLRQGSTVGVFAVEGLGGVGKTALAAEAVARLSQDTSAFPGGAAWISCEGLSGPEGLSELWSRVARALQADDVASLPDAEARRMALGAALHNPARPRLLLALDNIEPDLDANAVLDTLAGGRATLLVTARHAVTPGRLQALPLAPLPDPDAGTLFAQRLRQADPARPTAVDASAIPGVVALLGGLPLAVELEAAYAGIQHQDLSETTRELKEAGVAGAPLKALRTRFDRSWRVLTEAQQKLFAGLSIIEGATFPRAAALAVAEAALGGSEQGTTAQTPEEAVDALVALALVEPQSGGRLRLHPLLRGYAAENLGAMPVAVSEALGDALLAYWQKYAEAADNKDDMAAFDAEQVGLMGAIRWAHEHQRWIQVVALARAQRFYWDLRGLVDSPRVAYSWALEAAQALSDKYEEYRALHMLALLDSHTGRYAEAREGYEQALQIARELGDPRAEWAEVHELAVLDARAGRGAEARAGFERALELARQLGDPRAERTELHSLAVLDANAGRSAEAREGYEQALALARELGDPRAEWAEVHELAVLDARAGRGAEARAGFERALELARQLGDPRAEQAGLHELAVLENEAGHWAEARAGFERALELARQLGDPRAEQSEVRNIATVDLNEGKYTEARSGYETALTIARRLGDPAAQSFCLRSMGVVDVQVGETTHARNELTEALTIARRIQQPALIVEAVWWLAELDSIEGNRGAACKGFQEALALYEMLGNSGGVDDTRQRLRELGCEP